mgnify:FL=1|jgi:hypothetical protein
MRNYLTGIATATLIFGGLAVAGLAVVFFLMPDPPNIHRTSIYDITLPKGWTCKLEGTETVCNPEGPPPYRAQLIGAAKYLNPKMDTLDAYTTHLAKPKTSMPPDGATMTSTVERVTRTVIDGRTWVDATHLNSELRGYRTRYLAALTVQVAILITFSSYKDDFDIYQPMFEGMVRSINIYQRLNEAAKS